VLGWKLLRAAWDGHARTELDRLQLRPEGEVGARDTGRKSEEIFDSGRGGRLTTDRHVVEQDGSQSLGGAVDRR